MIGQFLIPDPGGIDRVGDAGWKWERSDRRALHCLCWKKWTEMTESPIIRGFSAHTELSRTAVRCVRNKTRQSNQHQMWCHIVGYHAKADLYSSDITRFIPPVLQKHDTHQGCLFVNKRHALYLFVVTFIAVERPHNSYFHPLSVLLRLENKASIHRKLDLLCGFYHINPHAHGYYRNHDVLKETTPLIWEFNRAVIQRSARASSDLIICSLNSGGSVFNGLGYWS